VWVGTATYCFTILNQALVITTQRRNKNHTVCIHETVEPFSAADPSTADIENVVLGISDFENRLRSAWSTYAEAKDVLIAWYVFSREQAVDVLEMISKIYILVSIDFASVPQMC